MFTFGTLVTFVALFGGNAYVTNNEDSVIGIAICIAIDLMFIFGKKLIKAMWKKHKMKKLEAKANEMKMLAAMIKEELNH